MLYPKLFMRLGLDMMTLGVESSSVMTLRMMKLAAGGPAAAAEAQLMVAEKIRASAEATTAAWTDALTGASHRTPARTVARYRRKVRANAKRLSKS